MNAKFGFIFLGCIFLLEAIWALFGGKQLMKKVFLDFLLLGYFLYV